MVVVFACANTQSSDTRRRSKIPKPAFPIIQAAEIELEIFPDVN